MRRLAIAVLILLSSTRVAAAQPAPRPDTTATGLATVDRLRLAEAFRLARALGDSVWPGWSAAPFAVLLVTPEREFLIGHPSPPAGFARVGYDSLLASEVLARPRAFPVGLLATFPIAGTTPVIVVGQAERTGKATTSWILTLLHEHFHQLQFSRPDYYARLKALDLARGDSTGMWALNYAFPYDSTAVRARFDTLAHALAVALVDTSASRASDVTAALAARAALAHGLAADDARYFEFQLWQEGVARYTEYRLATLAAARFTPSPAVRALPDFQPWAEARDSVRRTIVRGVSNARLDVQRREVAYPVGAALALLLDTARPSWRSEYLEHMFALP